MKHISIIVSVFIISVNFVFSQSMDQLNLKTDSIKLLIKSIDDQTKELLMNKLSLELNLKELNQKKNTLYIEKELVTGIPVVINFMGGILRDTPKGGGEEIIKIPSGDTIMIYNWYENPYFKATYKGNVGYISYSSFEKNGQIDSILINQQIERKVNKELSTGIPIVVNFTGILLDIPSDEGKEIIEIPSRDTILVFNWYKKPYFKASYKGKVGYISYTSFLKNKQIDKICLVDEYGEEDAERIINEMYWLGMTTKMARESLGSPDDINKNTGSWGVHQQWIYREKKLYLYFDN